MSSTSSQFYGKTSYKRSMELQAQALNQILGFEYDPVITLGKRAGLGEIKSYQGFEVVETDRGGFATLHSPGQLVIYPVMDLREKKISIRDFVAMLESTTKEFLDGLGIQTLANAESGVFSNIGKIAFIGLRVQSGITQHGISINLNNDLSLFESIRPCGVSSRALDSVKNHGIEMDLKQAFEAWAKIFQGKMNL